MRTRKPAAAAVCLLLCMLMVMSFAASSFAEEALAELHVEKNGLTLSGQSPDWVIVETVELPDHDFFVGVQFHPEFRSRPNRPHPLFLGLLHASISHGKKV